MDQSALCFSFNKGKSKEAYPRSLMGSIALLRQSYYDLDWYEAQTDIFNSSLKAIISANDPHLSISSLSSLSSLSPENLENIFL